MPRRLLLAALIAVLAVVLGFWSFTPSQAVTIVSNAGYWIMLVAVAWFGVVLGRSLRGEWPELRGWRRWIRPALVAAAGAAFLHLHEPHEFKVVADELVLGLTAKQMHLDREVSAALRAYDYAGDWVAMNVFIDKRPLLFPFLLSSLHDLIGFRPSNAFWLNGVLSVALMGLLLLVGRRIGGWSAGVAAVLLMTTIPLVAQNACSAGFDLLNLVMIVLVLWLGLRAANQPENSDRLSAFVLAGVLLTQVRYESVVFVLPVGATVLYLWIRQRAVLLPWPVLLTPLLMVLSPLQLNVFRLSESSWQLTDIAGADHPFAFRYFYDNIGHALNFFLATGGMQPNSLLVAVAGVFGVGFFVMLLYRRHRDLFSQSPVPAVFAIFLLGLMVHTALMLCYFWGHWDDPVIRRLSLPAHLLLVLSLVFVWPHIISSRQRWRLLIGVTLAYLVAFTVPSLARHRYSQQNFAARTTSWIARHIERLGDGPVLAIDRASGLVWLLYGKSSVAPAAIAARPESLALHFRNRTFKEMLVVQRAVPVLPEGRHALDVEDSFADALQLELIEERAFAPLYLVRLSRVVGLDEAKLKAWAERYRADHAPRAVTDASPTTPAPALPPPPEDAVFIWLRNLP